MTENSETPENPGLVIRVLNPEGSKGNGQFGWHFWADPDDADETEGDCA
ncbi:hypothetical protein ACF9IK_16100 [Kitasatospora hibisci]